MSTSFYEENNISCQWVLFLSFSSVPAWRNTDIPPHPRSGRGLLPPCLATWTPLSRSVHTQPSLWRGLCGGGLMGHEQGSWMLRVFVETGGDVVCEPCCSAQGRSAGIVVFIAITLKTWTGNIQRSACLDRSHPTRPSKWLVALGYFVGGGVDDMR